MRYKDIDFYELTSAYPMPEIFYNTEIRKAVNKDYLMLYNKYREMFTKFLLTETNLKKIDEEIDRLGYVKPLEKSQMDIYQYCVSDELKYLYIRNNFHIKRLNEREKDFIKNLKLNNEKFTKKEREFIKDTFQKVITEVKYQEKEKLLTNFGNEIVGFLAPNDAIIIGARYNVKNADNIICALNARGYVQLCIDKIRFNEGYNFETEIISHIYSKYEVNYILKRAI